MTPSPETQDQALRRAALQTIRRATEAGVSMETLRDHAKRKRDEQMDRDIERMEQNVERLRRMGWLP